MTSRLGMLIWLALVCASRAVHAHDVQGSAIYVDLGRRSVGLELHLPLRQLRAALESSLTDEQLARSEELRSYLAEHLRARSRAGAMLRLQVFGATIASASDDDELIATGTLVTEHASDVRWIELQCDLIVHRVVSHNIYVFLRRDLLSGLAGGEPELLGMLHWQRTVLVVDRERGSIWRALAASFALGARHIAEGRDHLMFLLMLLLPAPLRAREGRWREPEPTSRSVWLVITRVTAFTIGHALTLTAGALRGLALPAQAVEAAIATSVVLSALHALRPLFVHKEALLAGGFGLVHGLGFASALRGFGFDSSSLVLALFGFNLGVEAVQVGIVVLVAPLLLISSRHRRLYTWLRLSGAALGIVFGSIWIAEQFRH